jgi:hypothetical protein
MIGCRFLLKATLLTLLVLSACAPRGSTEAREVNVDSEPRISNGITVFGDARLGVAF